MDGKLQGSYLVEKTSDISKPLAGKLSKYMRNKFFNINVSPIEALEQRSRIGRKIKTMSVEGVKILDDPSLQNTYKNISQENKAILKLGDNPTIKVLRDNEEKIIKYASEDDIGGILAKIFRHANKGAKNAVPKTRQQAFDIANQKLDEIGNIIKDGKKGVFKHYQKDYKTAVDLKKSKIKDFIGSKLRNTTEAIFSGIPAGWKVIQKNIENINIPAYLEKVSPYKRGGILKTQAELKEGFQAFIVKSGTKANLAKEKLTNEKLLSEYGEYLSKQFKIKDNSVINNLKKLMKEEMDNNPEFINYLKDEGSLKYLLGKKKLNSYEAEELYDIVSRWSGKNKNPISSNFKKQAKAMLDDIVELEVPKQWVIPKEKVIKTITNAEREITKMDKLLGTNKSGSKLSIIKQELKKIAKSEKISLFHLMELKKSLQTLSNFTKSQGKTLSKEEGVYRRLYNKLDDIIDDQISKIDPKKFSKTEQSFIKNYKKNNAEFSLFEDLKNIMSETISSSKGIFAGHQLWLQGLAVFGSSGALGAASYAVTSIVGGLPGVLLAAGVGAGSSVYISSLINKIAKTGKSLLPLANRLDDFSKGVKSNSTKFESGALGKVAGVAKTGKSHISNVINNVKKHKQTIGTGYDAAKLYLFFNTSKAASGEIDDQIQSKDFSEVVEEIKQKPDSEIALDQDNDVLGVMSDYGGDEARNEYSLRMMQLKQMVKNDLPSGTYNELTRKTKYTKTDEKTFYRKIDKYLNPDVFLDSVGRGTLDPTSISKFQGIYPQIYNNIVLDLLDGLQNKTVKMTPQIQKIS